jgi:hypothetical protein
VTPPLALLALTVTTVLSASIVTLVIVIRSAPWTAGVAARNRSVAATEADAVGDADDGGRDENVGLGDVAGDLAAEVADAGGWGLGSAVDDGVPCCAALVSAAVSTLRRARHIAPTQAARRHRRRSEK